MNNDLGDLFSFLKKYKTEAILAIICSLLAVFFSVFSFFLVAPILNEIFEKDFDINKVVEFEWDAQQLLEWMSYKLRMYITQDLGIVDIKKAKQMMLLYICGFLVVFYLFKNIFRYLVAYILAPVRMGVVKDLRKTVYDKILTLDIAYFSDKRKGDIISRATADVGEVERGVLLMLEAYVREPITILISFIALVAISWKLTLIVLILAVFVGVVIGGIGKALKKDSKDAQERLGNVTSLLDETVFGLKVVRAFTGEKYFGKKLDKEDSEYKDLIVKVLRRKELSSPITEFLGIAVVAVLFWFGGRLVFDEEMNGGLFIAFIGLFYNIIAPAKSFSKASYNIRQGRGALERINDFLRAKITIKDGADSISKSSFDKSISYENVQFSYGEGDSVLKSFDLEIPKGQTVALVGSSGAGKSTVADLLPRFYDVTSGAIKIDGVDIKNIKLADARKLMSVVTQEAILFNDTIRNNITFGLEGVTEQDVIEACKGANAYDFIQETENGFDTVIGDRGLKLSGGQRQRITIARAILRNSEILILDEATSALDSESEKLVQLALVNLMKDRTSLVIAHRLSTIQHADQIIVMEKGEIVERGTHNELMKQGSGVYHKLVSLQAIG